MSDGVSKGAKLENSIADLAERIVQDAELRSKDVQGMPEATSERPGAHTEVGRGKVSTRSYLGMSRGTSDLVATDRTIGAHTSIESRSVAEGSNLIGEETERSPSKSNEDGNLYVSSMLGLPLLSDDPAPLSNALKIPTLLSETPSNK